jgi:tripartite-type tricarboxylate transporter receptor subunit TctC
MQPERRRGVREDLMIGFLRVVTCALLLLAPDGARAQTAPVQPLPMQAWPTRPIKLIVATGPGLATDIMARLLADGVSRTLGQPVFVENVPGASGILGAQAAARAAPDGTIFFFANASGLTSNMLLLKSIPYDPTRDFAAVALVAASGPFVVAVHPDLPVQSLAELIAYGKAQPGKLSYAVDASSGYGVVVGKLLNKRGGIGMVEVPYRATAQMLQDTAAGTVQLMISAVAASDAFVKAGKLRRIAISSAKRFPGMDDLPTIGETLPGFVIDGWFAVVAPAGTPPAIIQRLNESIGQFLQSAEIRQRMIAFGLAASGESTPQSAAEFIRTDQERWRNLVKELGIEPQ